MSDDTLAKMYDNLKITEEIDRVSTRMRGKDKVVFGHLSFPLPRLDPPSLGFLNVVSWLFALYYEAGKISVSFLNDKLDGFGICGEKPPEHYRRIQQLRTYFQHYLDLSSPRNQKIEQTCEEWLKTQCGTPVPTEDGHWHPCLIGLLGESKKYLEQLKSCIRQIEGNESRQQLLEEWEFRESRYFPPFKFDQIIEVVAKDMGRENLDPIKIRKRYFDKWSKDIESVQVGADITVEARKLVEHALLNELTPLLPITGTDVIAEFDLKPGEIVNEHLRIAQSLYYENRCTKAELLARLKKYVSEGGGTADGQSA